MTHHDEPSTPKPRPEDLVVFLVLAAPIFLVTFLIIAFVVTVGSR